MFRAIRNFFRQIRALWTLPGFCAVLTHKLSSESESRSKDLQNQIVALSMHLDTMLTSIAQNQNAVLGNLHVRLSDVIHNASQNVLYEAQLVRRMNCGSCRKYFGGGRDLHRRGFISGLECAVQKGLTNAAYRLFRLSRHAAEALRPLPC
jgi:hypothetical protein